MKPDTAETVYGGALVSVTRESWGEHEREIVEHPGSVAIVAVDDQSRVVLVRQLREAARRHLLELPAGTLEPDEDALTCARRELTEETGLRGRRWTELASFWTTPGFCRERMTLFVAEDVQEGPAGPAVDEQVELVRWPVEDIPSRLQEIDNAKTLIGLLLLLRRRN
jgi:ADP-ribose pyrophosphatase